MILEAAIRVGSYHLSLRAAEAQNDDGSAKDERIQREN